MKDNILKIALKNSDLLGLDYMTIYSLYGISENKLKELLEREGLK